MILFTSITCKYASVFGYIVIIVITFHIIVIMDYPLSHRPTSDTYPRASRISNKGWAGNKHEA